METRSIALQIDQRVGMLTVYNVSIANVDIEPLENSHLVFVVSVPSSVHVSHTLHRKCQS